MFISYEAFKKLCSLMSPKRLIYGQRGKSCYYYTDLMKNYALYESELMQGDIILN